MIKRIIPAALLLLMLASLPAVAQFEGKIVYNTYEISDSGNRDNRDRFTMYITPQRILLQGENTYDVFGPLQTEGLLIRLDFEDFVFLTGDQTVMKISKSDISSMMNLFGDDSEVQVDAVEGVGYRRTGETRMIGGYACEKFIFTSEEDPEDHLEAWMTPDLDINMGMLSEPWTDDYPGDITNGDEIFNLIMKEGYFPLEIRSYREGQLSGLVELAELSPSRVARAMVQIPSGVRVLSFQDYLFQRMTQQ